MARRFERVLADATDQNLMEPNWDAILECVDLIRCGGIPSEQAVSLIQKRYHHENPLVAHHALLVLEACVKDCGTKFHKAIASKEFMDDLKDIVVGGAQNQVEQKVLELVQCWASTFRDRSEYRIFVDTYNFLKTSGYQFPVTEEADSMITAESAPDLVDSDNCYRCRVKFGRLTRKHHCRVCGQIFCGKCSSKKVFLPQFGIDKKVRVCKTCFDESQKKADQIPQDQASERTASATNDEEEKNVRISVLIKVEDGELQPTSATCQSEAESRETERHCNLYRSYNHTDNGSATEVQDDNSHSYLAATNGSQPMAYTPACAATPPPRPPPPRPPSPRPPSPRPASPPPAAGGLPEKVATLTIRQTQAAPDRADLLQEVRMSAKLRHVSPPSECPPSGAGTVVSPDSVLTQTQQGTDVSIETNRPSMDDLHCADELLVDASDSGGRRSTSSLTDMPGIARALAMALEQRRKNILNANNSEETVDESDSDSEWESDF